MLETSIFSFSHKDLYLSQNNHPYLGHIYIVVCIDV